MLKKLALAFLVVIALPISTLAANIQSGDSLNITESQKNSYLFGSTVNVKAQTNGDLTVFANDIFIDEKVERSALAAGSNVRIDAPIEQNARIFAGTANVDKKIGEDLIVFAGTFTSAKGSIVADDLIVCAGSVTLNGSVGKNTKIYASNVTLNGKFSSDLEVRAEKITVSENTEIAGKLKYYSNKEAGISSNAKIGEIEFNKENYKFAFGEKRGETIMANFFFSLLGLVILALIINALLPGFCTRTIDIAHRQSGKSALFGFSYIVLAPIAIVLLMITLVGIPAALAMASVYVTSFFIAGALAAIFTGKMLINLARRPSENISWVTILVGSLAFLIIGLIPVFGWFVKLALVIISMGAIVQAIMPQKQRGDSQARSVNVPGVKLAQKKSSKNNGSKSRPKK